LKDEDDAFLAKYKKLNEAVIGVIEDYSLVSFIPLHVEVDYLRHFVVWAYISKCSNVIEHGVHLLTIILTNFRHVTHPRRQPADWFCTMYTHPWVLHWATKTGIFSHNSK